MGDKLRALRVADDIWIPAMIKANREDHGLSHVIRRFLREYARGEPKPPETH